jgi:hypothetical protein
MSVGPAKEILMSDFEDHSPYEKGEPQFHVVVSADVKFLETSRVITQRSLEVHRFTKSTTTSVEFTWPTGTRFRVDYILRGSDTSNLVWNGEKPGIALIDCDTIEVYSDEWINTSLLPAMRKKYVCILAE